MILAGDIGGTKTNLALYDENLSMLAETSVKNQDFDSFYVILDSFLENSDTQLKKACLGVAGPIKEGEVEITNLPWKISEQKLKQILSIDQVKLLNDLEALAYYIPYLEENDIELIKPGRVVNNRNISVIAVGTGLGETFLTWNGQSYDNHSTEGGHTEFAPKNDLEIGLLEFLMTKFDHVSIEKVCSAIGIENIFHFLTQSKQYRIAKDLQEKVTNSADPARVIIENSNKKDPEDICNAILEIFLSILGSEVGNHALKIMPLSGIYLGGGITPVIIPYLKSSHFSEALLQKGRMKGIIDNIPVYVIKNPKSGLHGAARYAFNEFI
jgi:glucokinase